MMSVDSVVVSVSWLLLTGVVSDGGWVFVR